MAASKTQRGSKGETKNRILALVRERAQQENWTDPKDVYPTLRKELGGKPNRYYNYAKVIADELLAVSKAGSHNHNGNGAGHHTAPAASKQEHMDDALTIAQRKLLRNEVYIGLLETLYAASDPEGYKKVAAIRDMLS